MKRLFISFLLILLLISLTASAEAQIQDKLETKEVWVIKIEGIIDPVIANYLLFQIEAAEVKEAEALIIQLDTPGGLDISMRTIVKKMLNARIPLIVYVAPSGARSASAGVFITLASHIAAMSPGTNIGAAHPVNLGGGQISPEMEEKVVNDAAAYIKTIAKRRGRNEVWAEATVRKSVSATEKEALKEKVIEYIAPNLSSLLKKIDGVKIKLPQDEVTLKTKEAVIVKKEMTFRQRLLHTLANPNIAYLLMMLGFYGILYELSNPGFGFSGIGGAIALILALYSFQVVPINYAGLALIIFAFILFVAEVFTPTYGILGAGGAIALLLGSLILIDSPSKELRVSLSLILPVVAATVIFFTFALGAGLKAQRRKIVTGGEGMVGKVGEARSDLDKEGRIFVQGELWKAISIKEVIKKGEKVKVVGLDGLKLKVEKFKEEE